VIKQFMD